MHPIHYSFILAVLGLLGALWLALTSGQPIVFLFALLVAYLLGGQTIGRFDEGGEEEPQDDDPGYTGNKAGFVRDQG